MYSQQTIEFLQDLKSNNSREWFAENKTRYETNVKEASARFCDDIAPILAAEFKTDVTSKVFRIHRNLRFSKDKTPYNAHIHISFRDNKTGAAWMFGLDPDRLTLGFGEFQFSKARLVTWRGCVAGKQGQVLSSVLTKAKAAGARVSDPHLKRVPSPFQQDHENADLLRRKGVALWRDGLEQDIALGPDAITEIIREFRLFAPMRDWFLKNLPAG